MIMLCVNIKPGNLRDATELDMYRDTQLQVSENLCDFLKFDSQYICQCFKIEGIF